MSKCDVTVTNMPKKFRKQIKAREKAEKNAENMAEEKPADEENSGKKCAKAVESDEVVLTIVQDDKGNMFASDGESDYPILNPGEQCIDERWQCRLLQMPTGPSAYLVKYLGKVESEAAEDGSSDVPEEVIAEVDSTDEEVPVETVPEAVNVPVVKESDLVKHLRRQLKEANTKNGQLEKELKDLPALKQLIKKQGVALQNYKTQVQSLESKNNVRNCENALSEMKRYKADCEAKDREIEKLKALLELSTQSTKGESQIAFITGETSIYSAMFDCMKYRVYFSPGKKTLRFIPDENGSVTVNDKGVVIPALAGYSNFLKARAIGAEKNGSEVLISLTTRQTGGMGGPSVHPCHYGIP